VGIGLMWSIRIENPEQILSLYGNYPSLEKVDIVDINIINRVSQAEIKFIINQIPLNPPKKWGKFNSVHFCIRFIGLESLSIEMNDSSQELTAIRMIDEIGSKILVTTSGLLDSKIVCRFVYISSITGINVDKNIA
jgi:hypothetical protein